MKTIWFGVCESNFDPGKQKIFKQILSFIKIIKLCSLFLLTPEKNSRQCRAERHLLVNSVTQFLLDWEVCRFLFVLT